ncbi:hypothetical protein [Paenibacillus cisolokensis]|uniref:hypothetical protein n=1 Tax=Paenibacillus cisolokensis TaxID=1658519 RepID=UPI00245545B0|nr:hypothetical protein [Paenibacillus cisolokensis]
MRKILSKYSEEAGLVQNLSPHKLRHFLLTWLNAAIISPDSRKDNGEINHSLH